MTYLSKLLIACLGLTLLSSPLAMAKKKPKLLFNKQQIDVEQDITGKLVYLNDDKKDADLLILQDNQFTYYPNIVTGGLLRGAQKIEIPTQAQFYNKGKLAGNEKNVLFYLTADKVMVYNFTTKVTQELFSVDSFYHYKKDFKIEYSNFAFDANNDGLTDVITYSLDKSHLYLQNKKGQFTHQILNMAPRVSSSSIGLNFSPYTMHHIDINGDKRKDISFQVDDQLIAFTQKSDGSFTHTAATIFLNTGILSELRYEELKEASTDKMASVTIKAIEDLNNDGIVDLITKEKVQSGMMSFENELMIRFGYLEQGLLHFHQKADGKSTFEGEGDLTFKDLNNDGFKDYYSSTAEMGLGMIMSVMSGSVDLDVRFHLMNTEGKYSKKPVFESEREIAISEDGSEMGLYEVKDFNGDGLPDLVIQSDDDEFKIFSGGDKKLFTKRGTSYEIDMPIKGRTEVKDFNGDGKADLLFIYGKKYDHDNKKYIGKEKLILWLSAD
jgi:hypothetical protein